MEELEALDMLGDVVELRSDEVPQAIEIDPIHLPTYHILAAIF